MAEVNWARRVYESDLRSAELCRAMQINGFGFDTERADAMRGLLRDAEAVARTKAEDAIGRKLAPTKTGGFKTADLEAAFFKDLRAPVLLRSELTGKPSLGVDVMRAYTGMHDPALRTLALAILEWRRARKIRGTYIDGVHVGIDGRVHPTWLNYGTVSGRFSCQAPNIMNLPRRENDPTWVLFKGGIRSLYVPRPGFVLVIFDAKQLEMRVAAYASGDEAMIAACEGADLHCENAEAAFGEVFAKLEYFELCRRIDADERLTDAEALRHATLKALRTMAKTAGFAICYLAEAETVYAKILSTWDLPTPPPTLRQVEAMLQRIKRRFRGYYRWQDERLLDTVRRGWVQSPILGRRRWLGHEPSPTENANFPIQSGAADLMNARLPAIHDVMLRDYPEAMLVAQVHDSGVFEVRETQARGFLSMCEEIFTAPIAIASSGVELWPSFPIDGEISERWH